MQARVIHSYFENFIHSKYVEQCNRVEVEEIMEPSNYGWSIVTKNEKQILDFQWFYENQMPLIRDIIIETVPEEPDEGINNCV